MATACTYCGQDLPRDDAHFCNNCGMLVPSHLFSTQSPTAALDSALPPQVQEKPVLREQMVHQLVETPAMQEQMAQRPRTTRRISPDNISASPIAWPAPITHVSVKDSSSQRNNEPIVQQVQQPAQNAAQRPALAERELHVKVWDNTPTPLPETKLEAERSDIEETPTSPLAVAEQTKIENRPSQNGIDKYRDDVEHLDTMPMPNNHASTAQPALPSAQSLHGNTPIPAEQRQQEYTNTPIPYSSMPPQPVSTASPSQYSNTLMKNQSPVPEKRRVNAPPAIASTTARRQKSRVPFIILLALLGLLVLGSGAWVILAQPFSISPVTQPLQSFKDAGLSVALSYPNSWSVQRNATAVLFSDSSHTAQVKLTVANSTSDVTQYVQQQATKNGMTAIKPLGTLSFAGASWQQIQGNMQQDGANYTTTMLATTHGNRMYMLTQMAPQNVYTDEDSVVFSAIRNSFAFL